MPTSVVKFKNDMQYDQSGCGMLVQDVVHPVEFEANFYTADGMGVILLLIVPIIPVQDFY